MEINQAQSPARFHFPGLHGPFINDAGDIAPVVPAQVLEHGLALLLAQAFPGGGERVTEAIVLVPHDVQPFMAQVLLHAAPFARGRAQHVGSLVPGPYAPAFRDQDAVFGKPAQQV